VLDIGDENKSETSQNRCQNGNLNIEIKEHEMEQEEENSVSVVDSNKLEEDIDISK